MIREIEPFEEAPGTLISCDSESLNHRCTGTGTPYLEAGAVNIFMNMPCPLKVVTKRELKTFLDEHNATHAQKLYSPVLIDGDSKGIEGELKNCKNEGELPEILVASGLHTVLANGFKSRFIDTGIYQAVTTPAMLQRMTPYYRRLVTEENIAVIGTGFWGVVCDLSLPLSVPYPRQWTDLTKPEYRDLLSVHGYHGKASITPLLALLRERMGDEGIVHLGANIRNIWHFAEILKRLDSQEKRRTPFNLLPNAATVQMPAKKNAGLLEFEEGPLLAPLLMYVKASERERCREVIDFFLGDRLRKTLLRGDFHLADEFDWNGAYCFPKWETLLAGDYEVLNEALNKILDKAFFL